MQEYQKVIINLLKASINKKKISFDEDNKIDWNNLVSEAKQHKISALIYSSIDRNSLTYIDNKNLDIWKQEIFKDSLIQIRNINSTLKLINNLNNQGIEVILLKGLVLRDLYPRLEYRTMSDVDILIREKDYFRVKNYLIKNDFEYYENNNPIHQGFVNSNKLFIEVHWRLINDNYLNRDMREFEEEVWKRVIDYDICGVHYKTLCTEDFLIHMCLHLAVHTKCSGFGLRQLYDMAVFINNMNINWEKFCSRVCLYGISKFTKGIFELLHQIFDIKVPKNVLENQYVNNQEIEILLNNILASGANGIKEEINGFEILCKCRNKEQYVYSNLKRIFKLFFPTRSELSDRYEYAKKHSLFLPIAWLHHAITGIVIKRYGLVGMFKYSKKSFDILNRRKKLIKSFELQEM